MQKEGMAGQVNFDIGDLADKEFYTFRKAKHFKEAIYYRWNFLNMFNKHYTRNADQMFDQFMEVELPKRIHQARPSIILNIDNEYMTFRLMEQIKTFYQSSANDLPKRHYFNRFVRDFK